MLNWLTANVAHYTSAVRLDWNGILHIQHTIQSVAKQAVKFIPTLLRTPAYEDDDNVEWIMMTLDSMYPLQKSRLPIVPHRRWTLRFILRVRSNIK